MVAKYDDKKLVKVSGSGKKVPPAVLKADVVRRLGAVVDQAFFLPQKAHNMKL